jgi:uncharacterized protein YbaP (TraB family)
VSRPQRVVTLLKRIAAFRHAVPAVALALLALGHGTSAQAQQSFLWEVKSDTATVYLFGTIHVGKKDMYPLAPLIEQALAASEALAVEADVEARSGSIEAAQATMYKPPDSLTRNDRLPVQAGAAGSRARLDGADAGGL